MDYGLSEGLKILLSFILGLILGSFLNVVIVRVPLGKSIITPGSQCTRCRRSLRWFDNVPLFSFLCLRGACRYCGAKISARYPVIEFLTALLFVAAGVRFGWSPLSLVLRDWPFLALLVSITFIDLEHRVIPDRLSLGGLILGLATFWVSPGLTFLESLGGAALGFGFFYSLAWIYHRMRGRMGLGGGDIKLLSMIGAFLGPTGVLSTVFVSSIFGSIVGLVWARVDVKMGKMQKRDMMRFAIPFGPFLVVGALLYYFLGDVLWYLWMNRI